MGGANRYPLHFRDISAQEMMGFAEFIIGPAEGRTRWLYPSYKLLAGVGEPISTPPFDTTRLTSSCRNDRASFHAPTAHRPRAPARRRPAHRAPASPCRPSRSRA